MVGKITNVFGMWKFFFGAYSKCLGYDLLVVKKFNG